MSYNVGTFHLDRFNYSIDKDTIINLDTTHILHQSEWLTQVDADVIALQEFFNNDMREAEGIISKLASEGYVYYYINPLKIKCFQGFFGVITFSKHPIIQSDSLYIGDSTGFNRAIYTDIAIKKDTIRVINSHLHSMSIRLKPTLPMSPDSLYLQLSVIKRKLEKGFKMREKQIKHILKLVEESPYPVIWVGDFNDTPLSYNHQYIKKHLNNAFEQAGNGFGFTYNKFPWFIRIDHQFYHSNKIKAINAQVLSHNIYSDHFPVKVKYQFINR